jgi:hypothetical protein
MRSGFGFDSVLLPTLLLPVNCSEFGNEYETTDSYIYLS